MQFFHTHLGALNLKQKPSVYTCEKNILNIPCVHWCCGYPSYHFDTCSLKSWSRIVSHPKAIRITLLQGLYFRFSQLFLIFFKGCSSKLGSSSQRSLHISNPCFDIHFFLVFVLFQDLKVKTKHSESWNLNTSRSRRSQLLPGGFYDFFFWGVGRSFFKEKTRCFPALFLGQG